MPKNITKHLMTYCYGFKVNLAAKHDKELEYFVLHLRT